MALDDQGGLGLGLLGSIFKWLAFAAAV
jgi:hypothetical protein